MQQICGGLAGLALANRSAQTQQPQQPPPLPVLLLLEPGPEEDPGIMAAANNVPNAANQCSSKTLIKPAKSARFVG